jgi:hypothetical protein
VSKYHERISRANYENEKCLRALKDDKDDVEWMFKELVKSL